MMVLTPWVAWSMPRAHFSAPPVRAEHQGLAPYSRSQLPANLHLSTASPEAPTAQIPGSSLLLDNGILYGTTTNGGAYGNGTIFKITKAGKKTILYNFKGGTDGANPQGALIIGPNSTLYGTTTNGGSSGDGTVYLKSRSKARKLSSTASAVATAQILLPDSPSTNRAISMAPLPPAEPAVTAMSSS